MDVNFRHFASRTNNTGYCIGNGEEGRPLRVPFPGMKKVGIGASSLGVGLVVSLAGWLLECEEYKLSFVDFNYSTQIHFFSLALCEG